MLAHSDTSGGDSAFSSAARRLGWRGVATLAIVTLAALAWFHHQGWREAQSELVDLARGQGVAGADLAELAVRMRREGDPTAARLVLAARLFDLEVASREPGSPASAERLITTRELAREALRAEPASWEAAMLLGAAVSLERARNRDPRLYSLFKDWERPLATAAELAPAEKQPRRLLAAAYLEVWPALAPAKRATVETLLREAFLEPHTFDRLYAPWVELAGTLDRAASLLPDEPVTWKRLAATALDRRAWSEYAVLSARFRSTLRATLDSELASASSGKRSNSANVEQRRHAYTAVLAAPPVDAEFAPLVETAVGLLPPGPAIEAQVRAARAWLAWALPLCLVRECPFAEPALGRLASLAGSTIGGGEAAFAALAAGDRTRSDLLERRSEELWSEPWAPYLTFKAKRQLARKETSAARESLLAVHRAFRSRLTWRSLAEHAAVPGASPGPTVAREQWEASDWWFEHGASRLDLLPSRPAAALWLELAEAARSEALLEVQWDGRALPPIPVAAGATALRLPIAVTSEPHLLEIHVRAGNLRPATRVRLE